MTRKEQHSKRQWTKEVKSSSERSRTGEKGTAKRPGALDVGGRAARSFFLAACRWRRRDEAGQRARAGGEGAGDHDGPLAVPRLVVRHDRRVHRHVHGRELRQLVGLGVDPAERLEVGEVLVLGQLS